MSAVPEQAAGTVTRGIAFALLAAFTFAVMDGVAKHLVGTYDVLQVMWVRYAFFTAFGVALALRQGGLRAALRSRRPGLQLLRSLILMAEVGGFLLAFKYMALADVHAIAAAAPLFVTALAWPLLGERVGPVRWAAVLVGFAGVLIIIRRRRRRVRLGRDHPAGHGADLRALPDHDALERPRRSAGRLHGLHGRRRLRAADPGGAVRLDAAERRGLGAPATDRRHGLRRALVHDPGAAGGAGGDHQPFNCSLVPWAALVGYVLFGDLPDGWTIAGAAVVAASGLFILERERRQRGSSGS